MLKELKIHPLPEQPLSVLPLSPTLVTRKPTALDHSLMVELPPGHRAAGAVDTVSASEDVSPLRRGVLTAPGQPSPRP